MPCSYYHQQYEQAVDLLQALTMSVMLPTIDNNNHNVSGTLFFRKTVIAFDHGMEGIPVSQTPTRANLSGGQLIWQCSVTERSAGGHGRAGASKDWRWRREFGNPGESVTELH
jgi:hypothetical protein